MTGNDRVVKDEKKGEAVRYVGDLQTGVYHRLSCFSNQLIESKNVKWFSSSIEAEEVGYVPCQACKPQRVEARKRQEKARIAAKEQIENEKKEITARKFPGVLWLLPIFFGLLGGIVAAMISSMKYQASWWELFTVGLIITLGEVLIYVLFLAAIFSSM